MPHVFALLAKMEFSGRPSRDRQYIGEPENTLPGRLPLDPGPWHRPTTLRPAFPAAGAGFPAALRPATRTVCTAPRPPPLR